MSFVWGFEFTQFHEIFLDIMCYTPVALWRFLSMKQYELAFVAYPIPS